MNASFSPVADGIMNVRNKSRKIFFDEARNYQTQTITDSNPEFNILGNFFISEGKPGKVLKVHVKKRMGCDFYRAIELTISQDFPLKVSQPQYIGNRISENIYSFTKKYSSFRI